MPSILVMLEDAVRAQYGDAVLAATRASAISRTLDLGVTSRASTFVTALASVRQEATTELCVLLGRGLVAPLFRELPVLGRRYQSSRELLLQITAVASDVSSALFPDLEPPYVDVELRDAKTLRLGVSGVPEVAAALEGLVQGIADHFSERVVVLRVESGIGRRHLLDVVLEAERRSGSGGPPPPPGAERRTGVLGGVTTFLR